VQLETSADLFLLKFLFKSYTLESTIIAQPRPNTYYGR